MSDDRTEIQSTKIAGVQDLLAFTETDKSLLSLKEYVIVPFCKCVQGMSKQELKDEFGEGAVILQPGGIQIGGREMKFLFVPEFFYTEYRQWADRDDDKQMIVESTYDPLSELAKKAKDHERWNEPYPEDEGKEEPRMYRYVEHLCFVGKIYSGPHKGARCMISFQKGDFRVGRSFASGLLMRKVNLAAEGEVANMQQVPLWAQVWEMEVNARVKGNNKWWGIDPKSPSEGASPMILPEEYAEFKQSYEDLADAHAGNRLRVDGQDNDEEATLENKDF